MKKLVRFGVAMEDELLGRFDELIESRGFANRSEALRDLVRRELDRDAWESGGKVVATVTLVYDHHVRELTERLNEMQHDLGEHVISTLHVHLDHEHCMEVIAARGPALEIKKLSARLLGAKGVLSGDVTAAARCPTTKRQKHAHHGRAHAHAPVSKPKRRG